MLDMIVVAGAPGAGKSTLCRLLWKALEKPPYLEFSRLREIHLDEEWSNEDATEEAMAFDNLTYVIANYGRHGYRNILVTDLEDFRVRAIPKTFGAMNYLIFSLVITKDDVLKERLLDPARESGYRNTDAAVKWNRLLIERPCVSNEYKIDNTFNNPMVALDEIVRKI